MTHEQLLNKWCDILGLNDWSIKLYDDCTPLQMSSDAFAGEVEYDVTIKCASVRILNEKYCTDQVPPFQFEETLIHELLHCKFALLDDTGDQLRDTLLHQYINDLAKSFYKAVTPNAR